MFVSILTIIYIGIALFVLARYTQKKASKIVEWKNRAMLRSRGLLYNRKNWNETGREEEPLSELQAQR